MSDDKRHEELAPVPEEERMRRLQELEREVPPAEDEQPAEDVQPAEDERPHDDVPPQEPDA